MGYNREDGSDLPCRLFFSKNEDWSQNTFPAPSPESVTGQYVVDMQNHNSVTDTFSISKTPNSQEVLSPIY